MGLLIPHLNHFVLLVQLQDELDTDEEESSVLNATNWKELIQRERVPFTGLSAMRQRAAS